MFVQIAIPQGSATAEITVDQGAVVVVFVDADGAKLRRWSSQPAAFGTTSDSNTGYGGAGVSAVGMTVISLSNKAKDQ